MKNTVRIISIFLAMLLVMVAGAQAIEVGKPAPDFTLRHVFNDKPFSLSDYKDKNLIISFFNTRCAACEAEINVLGALRDKYENKFEILMVSTDFVTPKLRETMGDYVKRMNVSKYNIVSDPKLEFAEQFGFTFTPAAVGIDTTGKVAFVHAGFGRRDNAVVEKYIKEMVEK